MKQYRVLVKMIPQQDLYVVQKRNVFLGVSTPWKDSKAYETHEEAVNVVNMTRGEKTKMMGSYFEDGVQFTQKELESRRFELAAEFEAAMLKAAQPTATEQLKARSTQVMSRMAASMPAMPALLAMPKLSKKKPDFEQAVIIKERKEYKVEISSNAALPFQCWLRTVGADPAETLGDWKLIGAVANYETAKKIGEEAGATYTSTIVDSPLEKKEPIRRKVKRKDAFISSTDESDSATSEIEMVEKNVNEVPVSTTIIEPPVVQLGKLKLSRPVDLTFFSRETPKDEENDTAQSEVDSSLQMRALEESSSDEEFEELHKNLKNNIDSTEELIRRFQNRQ